MAKFILGSKLNMSQAFDENGKITPVTVLKVGPVKVVQVKTEDRDGYKAVQVGIGSRKKVSKAIAGHAKANYKALREFRLTDETLEVGATLDASQFTIGDFVDVQGIMKGRGFTGAVKRYGFRGAPASHGHDHPRAVGSIGGRFPQHTMKGKRMAGRMGGKNVTVKNLEVVQVDAKRNLIAVKGAVPGANGGLVKISQSRKVKKS